MKWFLGTIVKSAGAFMLVSSTGKIDHQLDHAQAASQFEGKKVRVTGVLDSTKNVIHVQGIAEVAEGGIRKQ